MEPSGKFEIISKELEVMSVFLGEDYGPIVKSALTLLSAIPPRVFIDASNKINRETTIGPFINPTAYLDGRRFENAREYCDLFEKLGAVTRFLERFRKD